MINIGSEKVKLYLGSKKVKYVYKGVEKVYSVGNIVTYYVDSGVSYQEEVDSDASCLTPKTFIPTKNDWEFVGWREDNTASSEVLSSKIMGDNPIILYAVFRHKVTVTYYNGNTTANTTYGYKYYNNNNVTYPSFTLAQSSLSGWTARGWSTGTTADDSIYWSNNTTYEQANDITLYGMYYNIVTIYYNGNGADSGNTSAESKTAYFNSNGNASYPSFTLKQNGYSRTNYTFHSWILYNSDGTGTSYSPGASIHSGNDFTVYAYWIQQVYEYEYNSNGYAHVFTAPVAGTYKLEVYGAQGGNAIAMNSEYTAYTGGYGGYSYGNVALNANTTLYVVVGGQGGSGAQYNAGGFNGGGTGVDYGGGGGGATHIGINNTTLAGYGGTSGLYIVAGGGGGGGTIRNFYLGSCDGGTGGGTTGGNGGYGAYSGYGTVGTGGTQSSGYAFGQGGSGSDQSGITYHGSGGGGGLYGGTASGQWDEEDESVTPGGGGGSGYIGGVSNGSTSNGQRSGNGYAKITLVSIA